MKYLNLIAILITIGITIAYFITKPVSILTIISMSITAIIIVVVNIISFKLIQQREEASRALQSLTDLSTIKQKGDL